MLLTTEALEKKLTTSFTTGLTTLEVIQRQKKFGKNVLETQEKRWWVKILLEQFSNPLIFVLVFAAILALLFQEQLEAIAIIVVIVINATIGFFMEWQASRSMNALKKLATHKSTVLRDGENQSIDSKEIVVGDIVIMEAGDVVPADARIIQHQNLGVNESILTGESNQISKTTDFISEANDIIDQKNNVFKGTVVSRGNAKVVVTHIGKNTELGKIATLVRDSSQSETPIEKKLNTLGNKLILLTFVLAILVVIIGIFEGRDLYVMIKTAIALAVAAIPEGLPVVATIALARGMLRLSKQNVIVKKLSAVETLGEVQVIFTDKTGTLTENLLHVQTVLFSFGKFSINTDLSIRPTSTLHAIQNYPVFEKLLLTSVLCNNAQLGNEENGEINDSRRTGDPLEIALLEFGKSRGLTKKNIEKKFPRIKEIPFDATSKMMGTLHQMPDGKYLVCVKGALEVILQESDAMMTDEEDEVLSNYEYWRAQNNKLAAKGERTLAMAYSIINAPDDDFFHNLIFIGCIGFLDPPRSDIKAAIEACHSAGINVIMVTGDHPETAKNIAQQVGLAQGKEPMVINGNTLKEINELNKFEIDNLMKTNVFARVSPAQKLNIINLFQSHKYIVGMTGDGVNDAPALKKSEIGIAMGQRGTEAAKEAAELILEDDSFNSIVIAIKQGRGIFNNIRHFVIYLLSCNLGEIFVLVFASFFSWGNFLLPIQILFLNMVTDVFPALALGLGNTPQNVMQDPPRKSGEPFVTNKHWRTIFIYAFVMASSVLVVNYWASEILLLEDLEINNLIFYTLILVQLLHVFNLSGRSVSFFFNEITKNKFIWGAIIICILIPIFLYQFESVRLILNLRTLNLEQTLGVIGFSIIPIIVIQFLKKIKVV